MENKFLDLEGLEYYHGKIEVKLNEIEKVKEEVSDINSNTISIDDTVILNCGNSVTTEN